MRPPETAGAPSEAERAQCAVFRIEADPGRSVTAPGRLTS